MGAVLLQYWNRRHREEIGQPYLPIWNKDTGILNSVATIYGLDNSKTLIDNYFKMLKKDEFVKKAGVSIGVFKSQIPKLVLLLKTFKADPTIGKL